MDLAAAGIPKVDERGHRIDVHPMRTTFNTLLAVAGVDPRIAMAAMRVSSLDLVQKTHTDKKQLDATNAVNTLPVPPQPTPTLAAGGLDTPTGAGAPIVAPTSAVHGVREGLRGVSQSIGQKIHPREEGRNLA